MHSQHPIFDDEQMKAYFETLPLVAQEAVFQSGIQITTLQELKDFAAKYTTE